MNKPRPQGWIQRHQQSFDEFMYGLGMYVMCAWFSAAAIAGFHIATYLLALAIHYLFGIPLGKGVPAPF